MDKIAEWALGIISGWPLYVVIIVVVFAFCVWQIEHLLLLRAEICGFFSKISRRARKGQIANSLRGSILKVAKKKEFVSLGILPDDMKIVWADQDTPTSFFADNQVVIRIRQDQNPNVNYVKILSQFITSGLFMNGRHYYDDTILEAADLLIVQDIVAESRPSAHKEFHDLIYKPAIERNPDLKEDYDVLVNLDRAGLFYLVYLNELNKVQASMIGKNPDPCLQVESREVMRFLNNIALKVSDNPDDLNISNNYFKFGIVYAISDKTLWRSGYEAHIKVIRKLVEQGYRTIYVLASGRKREVAAEIAYMAKASIPEIVSSYTHRSRRVIFETGKRTDGICIELTTY